MKISIKEIQILRDRTGIGVVDAKSALEKSGGDIEAAIVALRKAGKKVAEKKQSRQTSEGTVGVYLHSNKKLLTAVALACETDFVARTEVFQELAHDLAMHVAAANPKFLNPESIPADLLEKETEIARTQAENEGKPVKIIDNIVEGKIAKFTEDYCLLKQRFFKEDKKTVEQILQEAIQKLGENIQIKNFVRFTV